MLRMILTVDSHSSSGAMGFSNPQLTYPSSLVKVAVVVESEREKMFAFGTPSAGPIIDSFLSGNVEGPIPHEVQKANIIFLENKLVRLGNLKDVQDRRMRVSMARSKEIQESSKIAKLVYVEIDDLSVHELNELLHGLTRINQ